MLRYSNMPPRRRECKPVTKAMAQQRRTEALNRRFRFASDIFFSLAACVIIFSAVTNRPMLGKAPQVGDMLVITSAGTAPGASLARVSARLIAGP